MKLKHLLAWILTLTLLCGCAAPAAKTPAASPDDAAESPALPEAALSTEEEPASDVQPQALTAQEEEEAQTNPVLGFLIPDDESLQIRCAMHGFLRTAENLNAPARLYAIKAGEDASAAAQQALSDGCDGVLVWADSPELKQAAKTLSDAGVPVVVPYTAATVAETGARSILAPDPADFCAEALRILCEETISRGNESGVIAIVREPGAHQDIFDAFSAAALETYPQFTLSDQPLSGDAAADKETARAFIKEHADIAGIISLSPGGATAWYDGELLAEAELKKEITATPAPVNGVKQKDPRKRTPVIMGLDYTEENIALVQEGKIYALIARPFYTAAAQAAMALDSLLHGAAVQQTTRVNAPVIRKKDVDKYAGIVSEVKEWFGM